MVFHLIFNVQGIGMKKNSIILALACTFLAYLAYSYFNTAKKDEAVLAITSNDPVIQNNSVFVWIVDYLIYQMFD